MVTVSWELVQGLGTMPGGSHVRVAPSRILLPKGGPPPSSSGGADPQAPAETLGLRISDLIGF